MKKVFPKSNIRKEIIGEVTGFDRVQKSEACELVSSLTGDNSREVVSFGTEAGLFQELGISTVAVSYTHLRAHETRHELLRRLLLE